MDGASRTEAVRWREEAEIGLMLQEAARARIFLKTET